MDTSFKNRNALFILATSFLLAFCSFGYQFLISKTLIAATQKGIFCISLTTGFFILGLGLAARNYRRRKSVTDDPYGSLYRVEWILSILGGATPVLLLLFYCYYKSPAVIIPFLHNPNQYIFFYIIVCQVLSFFVGYTSGFEVPLMNLLLKKELSEQKIYQVLGVTAFGGLAAAVLINWLFIPGFDLIISALILGSLNYLVCLWLFSKRGIKSTILNTFVLMVPLSAFVLIGTQSDYIYQLFLKSYYIRLPTKTLGPGYNDGYWDLVHSHPDVERHRTLYQYVDIVNDTVVIQDPDKGYHLRHVLFVALDGQVQFGADEQVAYHDLMAHTVFSSGKKVPSKVLILGAGDGLLARELLRYPEIKNIHMVELDPQMIYLATHHPVFTDLNLMSLKDPRVHVEIGDAAKFLTQCHNEYSAIFIDFPFPNTDELSKLYSREFYRLVYNCLTDDGTAIMDYPVRHTDHTFDRTTSIFANTLKAAGFQTIWPYGVDTYPFLLVEKQVRTPHFEPNQYFHPQSLQFFKDYDPKVYHYDDTAPVNSLFKPQLLGLPSQEMIFSRDPVNR